jgi:hypothetical protein
MRLEDGCGGVCGACVTCDMCVAAAWRCGLAGLVQRITVEAEKKTPPGTVATDITLVLTDVQVRAVRKAGW